LSEERKLNLGSQNMFQINKKEPVEPEDQKPKKGRWWVAHSYYEDAREKEMMKKNVDFKLSKNKF